MYTVNSIRNEISDSVIGKINTIAIKLRLLSTNASTIIFLCLILFSSNFAQPPASHSEGNKDQALKGSGRVNASTLGMEISIPLGSYPGRGINVPVSLSYSSKVWRSDFLLSEPFNQGGCYSVNVPRFADRSASGWTSSLAMPYIEYTGWENFYDERGFPKMDVSCSHQQSPPPPNLYGLIKRITVHLPSGETHELRMDDTKHIYSATSSPPSKNGTYYATDGSNIKYIESSSGSYKLLMPDGSTYQFSNTTEFLNGNDSPKVRKANKFADRNGNFTIYDSSTNSLTDTLGRTIEAPFDLSAPTSPTTAAGPQIYNMPGLSGGNVTYKFHWKKLKGTTANESGLSDFNDTLKYPGDHYYVSNSPTTRPSSEVLFSSEFESKLQGLEIFNPIVLTKIELPTGQSYKFSYDIYGRIENIYYPTGGEEHFAYSVIPGLTRTQSGDVSDKMNVGVTNRKLYERMGGDVYEWTYSAGHVQPKGYKVAINNPDGIVTERFLHRAADPCNNCQEGTFGYDNGIAGMPYETRVFDKSGEMISRNLTHYTTTEFNVNTEAIAHWHPRATHSETYLYDPSGNGEHVWSTTRFEYENEMALDQQRDAPLLKRKTFQYDYQSSSGSNAIPPNQPGEPPVPNPTPVPTSVPTNLIRTSEVKYLINDTSVTNRQSYIDKNMIGLITESLVMDSADKIVSKTKMKYDESGYSPQNYVRGNPTTSRVYVATSEINTSSTFIDTHAKFDDWGNQIESTDALARTIVTEYDATNHAFPIKVTSPIPNSSGTNGSNTSFVTEATFDFNNRSNTGTGLPLTTTDANGVETRISYDSNTLRPLNIKNYYQNNQIGSTVETIYDDVNNKVTKKAQIDANSWTENISYYDGLGRTYKSERVHSDGNIFVEKEFDADGRVNRVSNPFRTGETKLWTTNVYDDAGRVVEVILQDGAKVKTAFAVSVTGIIGTTKQITDQAGKKRSGINDVLGRMVKVIEDPDGQALETNYEFDTLGNLRETIQGEQHRFFMHDSLGRLLYSKQPEEDANPLFIATDSITSNTGWSNKYEYDDGGNITSTTNARGDTVSATYDDIDRIILRDYSDSTPDVSFFYDGTGLDSTPAYSKGKTTKVSSSASETRYTSFDNLGRLLSHEQVTQGESYQTEYTYNLSGSMLTEKYPSGRVMNYEYRADGELDKLTGTRAGNTAIKTYLNNVSYNTLGNIDKMRLGNGTWESSEYNDRQQIKQIALGQFENDESLLKIDYDYGKITENNGSIKQQKINYNGLTHEITQDYTYDDLNRLKSAKETGNENVTQTWKQTFDYDRFGNREFDPANTTTIAQSVATKITNPEIATSSNRLKKDQDGDSIVDYDYDTSGNVTLDAENQRFIYDAENRIKEFFKTGNRTQTADAAYQYDGDGKRVRKISEETETIFVYNASGQLVAEYSNKVLQSPKVSYLTEDHLGSPRIITDDDKDVVSRHDYLAFGDEVTETIGNVAGRTNGHGYGETDDIRQQYTGYERDKESGLDFAQARYYNPQHGRFTSVDPMTASANVKNPQTFNRYSYVLNSPYKFVDPLGLISMNSAACGGGCSNRAASGGGLGIGLYSGAGMTIGIGKITAPPPQPPPADGITSPDEVTPTVQVSSTISGSTDDHGEGTAVLPKGVHDALQTVAETTEQVTVAQDDNSTKAVAGLTREFNKRFTYTNPTIAKVLGAEVFTPDFTTLDGTIVPIDVPDIGFSISTGPVTASPASVGSAYSPSTIMLVNAANSQNMELTKIRSSSAAKNFAAEQIKKYGDKNGRIFVKFTPKGKSRPVKGVYYTKDNLVKSYKQVVSAGSTAADKR